MANASPKKPKRTHPWKAKNQRAFEADLEAKRIKLGTRDIGYDDRSHKGQGLFGTGRGMKKR